MDITTHNQKWLNIIKTLSLSTLNELMKSYTGIDRSTIESFGKQNIESIVEDNIKNVIGFMKHECNEYDKPAILKPKPNSLLSYIDIDDQKGAISVEQIQQVASVLSRELTIYNAIVFMDMVKDKERIKDLIHNQLEDNLDVDITIVTIDNEHIVELLNDNGVLITNPTTINDKNIVSNIEPIVKATEVDVERYIDKFRDNEVRLAIQEYLNNNPGKEHLVEEANDYLIQLLSMRDINVIYKIPYFETDVMILMLIGLRTILDNNELTKLQTMLVEDSINKLCTAIKKNSDILSNIKNNIKRVVTGIEKENNNEFVLYVIGENYKEAINIENVTMDTFKGIAIIASKDMEFNKKYLDIKLDDIRTHYEEYNKTHDIYVKTLTYKNINNKKSDIINVYLHVLAPRYLEYKKLGYTDIDYSNEMFLEQLYDELNYVNLDELYDVNYIVGEIYEHYLANKTNLEIYLDSYEKALRLLGEDINKDLADMIAILDLITYTYMSEMTMC